MMYYAVGDSIVTPKEFTQKMQSGEINQFYDNISKQQKVTPVNFSTGELNSSNFITPESVKLKSNKLPPKTVPFTDIGEGKPLTIMIRAVYTGEYPGIKFPGQKIGMLVSSAVKDVMSFDAQPKAMNFLLQDVSSKSYLNKPSASSTGTPIVYYSPAVLEESLTMDLSMIFDKFPEPVFNSVGQIMQTAGGIPAFLPYNTFLLTMGGVTKIVGKIGEKLFDGSAQFSTTQGLDICIPGVECTPSGFIFIFGRDIDKKEPNYRKEYRIGILPPDNNIVVLDENNQEYSGDVPYIILSYDGTPRDKLKNFIPTAASAAILSRFYGIKEGESQTKLLDTLIDSCKLYNDLKLRKQIDSLKKQNDGLLDDDETKKKNLERIKALEANIQTDDMKYK
jgi:hypothetical protein